MSRFHEPAAAVLALATVAATVRVGSAESFADLDVIGTRGELALRDQRTIGDVDFEASLAFEGKGATGFVFGEAGLYDEYDFDFCPDEPDAEWGEAVFTQWDASSTTATFDAESRRIDLSLHLGAYADAYTVLEKECELGAPRAVLTTDATIDLLFFAGYERTARITVSAIVEEEFESVAGAGASFARTLEISWSLARDGVVVAEGVVAPDGVEVVADVELERDVSYVLQCRQRTVTDAQVVPVGSGSQEAEGGVVVRTALALELPVPCCLPDGTCETTTVSECIAADGRALGTDDTWPDEDTDGDGLLDGWECCGVPYRDVDDAPHLYVLDVDADGIIDADVFRKNIFVEIDAMDILGVAPSPADLVRVVRAFDRAPVPNPDGTSGIELQLQYSDAFVPAIPMPSPWDEFDVVKLMWFGTVEETSGDPATVEARLDAKRLVYRYCLFAEGIRGSSISGMAEIGGNDLIVSLGRWSTIGGTSAQKAGTFMHELGHTLGLRHWGPESQGSSAELVDENDRLYNLKPNYYSIMNYTWQTPSAWMTKGSWPLAGLNAGFSSAALRTLDESNLDESLGLVPGGLGGTFPAPGFVVPFNTETDPAQPPDVRAARIAAGAGVDWDNDGTIEPFDPATPIARDVNRTPTDWPVSPDTTLIGYADWPYLDYDFRDGTDFADGVHEVTTEDTEITQEHALVLDTVLPAACVGDITGDGDIGVPDLLEILGSWGPCPVGIACIQDLDDDAVVGVTELLALLGAWGPCP